MKKVNFFLANGCTFAYLDNRSRVQDAVVERSGHAPMPVIDDFVAVLATAHSLETL